MRKWILSAVAAAITGFGGVAFVGTRDAPEVEAAAFEEADVRIRISIADRKLYFEEGGKAIATWSVAVGTAKHPTPKGSYAARRVIWNPKWVPPEAEWAKDRKPTPPGDPKNPMGKVKVFFKEPDYYIHGTNDEKSIGSAASHGCVRMRNADIVELSRLLVKHGGAPIEPSAIQRILNRVRQSHEVRLSRPVPVRVQA